jgi:glycosyltransferase involved in cell wall biosynthesis
MRLPVVLLGAMAAKVPIVTTRVGAIATVIESGRNGWLVAPGDSAELGTTLQKALDDPEGRRRFAEQAFLDYQEKYTREAMGAKYLELYLSLAGRAEKIKA